MNFLDNKINQQSKTESKINDDVCGTYNTHSQIKFKTSRFKVYVITVMHIYLLKVL